MTLEPVPTGHPYQDEAAVVVGVALGQLGAQLVDTVGRHLQQLSQQAGLDRLLRHHQDRLEGAGRFAGHQPAYSSTSTTTGASASSPPVRITCSSAKVPCC